MAPLTNRIDSEQPYTAEEAEMLTRAVLVVSEKYPDFDYAEELGLALVIAAQLGGRFIASQARKAIKDVPAVPAAVYDVSP